MTHIVTFANGVLKFGESVAHRAGDILGEVEQSVLNVIAPFEIAVEAVVQKVEVDLHALTVPDLKAHADENGIDISGLTRKDDIKDAIIAATASAPEVTPVVEAPAPVAEVAPAVEAAPVVEAPAAPAADVQQEPTAE